MLTLFQGDSMKQEIAQHLRRNTLCSSVSARVVNRLTPSAQIHTYGTDEYIFRQGEKDHRLWLVISGEVGIYNVNKNGEQVKIAKIGKDDYFGEFECIDGLPRSTDAKALSDVELIALPYDTIRDIIKRNSTLAFNLMQQLSIRLRKTNQLLFDDVGVESVHQENVSKLTRLIEAAKSINSTLNLDLVLEIILDTAIQSTRADRGTLYLVDEQKQEIWSKLLHGEQVGEIRLPLGTGIAGYVAQSGETVNTANTYDHPYFNPEVDQRSGYQTHSMLCMPMRNTEGRIIGVFQLLNKDDGVFTREDEEFLDALSVHASIALENAKLHREVVQNERLLAVGRMASTIIHDLKSPMNTIKAHTKYLHNIAGNEETIRVADEVFRQADRLIKMVQEILDFTRGTVKLDFDTVNVEEMIMTIFRFLERDFKERNITIDTELNFGGEWRMDADKMIRVLFNIAGNAADAMKDGGSLVIRTSTENGFLKIELSDTGIGMSPHVRSRLFEPFFTYGKQYGTGLGLAIVKKIIDDHGGTISVDSEEGRGTTFTIRLPQR